MVNSWSIIRQSICSFIAASIPQMPGIILLRLAGRCNCHNVSVENPENIVKGSHLPPGNSLEYTWLACISLRSIEGIMVMKYASMAVIFILILFILIFSAGQSYAQSPSSAFPFCNPN